MPKRYGRICGPGGKTKTRGHRFLKITANGSIYDITSQFTGKRAKPDHPRKKAKPKRKPTYGRKRSGPIKGFASRAQKRAAMKNVKKAQRARRRGY